MDDIIIIAFFLLAVAIATIGRELFLGLVALVHGDETPRIEQRITLNPFKHIDWLGTIIIPITLVLMGVHFIFGYAKPMPINFQNIQENTGYKGCLRVALSATFFNFLVAFSAVATLKLVLEYQLIDPNGLVTAFFVILIHVNIMLAIFNLLPIPPLCGAKILAYLGLCFNTAIFARWYNNCEKYGMIIVTLLILLPQTREGMVWVMKSVALLFFKL